MQIAQVLSGFSAGEADLLEEPWVKKGRIRKTKSRFVEGAYNNGIAKILLLVFLKLNRLQNTV